MSSDKNEQVEELEISIKGTPEQIDAMLESGDLQTAISSLTAEFDAETEETHVHALVSLTYNGLVTKEVAGELLESALEHVREEGMLSDPEWLNDPATEELACDEIKVRIL